MECVRITACRARGNGIMPGSGSEYGGAYNITSPRGEQKSCPHDLGTKN